MPVVGARALLPATRLRPLPRVAGGYRTRHHDPRGLRAFSQTPPARQTQPDRPDGANGSGGGDENDAGSSGNSEQLRQGAEPLKEALKSRGYGSARARAQRGKTAEEGAPIDIPDWFFKDNVVSFAASANRVSHRGLNRLLGTGDKLELDLIEASDVDAVIEQRNPAKVEALANRLAPLRSLYPATTLRPNTPRKGAEAAAYRELVAAVRTDLAATARHSSSSSSGNGAASSKRPSRPVTVLSVLNYKGRAVSTKAVRDAAVEVGADVVHLDASTIARLVGAYLDHTPYWSRSSISMLGYAVAEANGRLLPRERAASDGGPDGDDPAGGLVISIPSRVRSMLAAGGRKEPFFFGGGGADERWEDIKMGRALEALIGTIDRAYSGKDPRDPKDRKLIVHVMDYLEMGSVAEGVLAKIRSIVDRMRQGGRRVVVVGSSSGNIYESSQWRGLLQTSREDCHLVPLHADLERGDGNWREEMRVANLRNICVMLRALEGVPTTQHCGYTISRDSPASELLSKGIFDVHWVYRVASLMLGSSTSLPSRGDTGLLQRTLDTVMSNDKQWDEDYDTYPPYYSPVFSVGAPGEAADPGDSGGGAGGGRAANGGMQSGGGSSSSSSSNGGSSSNQQYDVYEKRLLSGLVNAKDIRTTFDDIVAPAATKESLETLTTLSLVRPEAFTYGVLKTERIPGCLLYGPPGTGKTLLAKAVAKSSGANMLEVSAASINDMYVGQSEKNVRALFSLARKLSPAVVFLDEADALLGSRQAGAGGSRRAAHREVLTQFLREWDGVTGDTKAFIMVATNRPFDLDEAVLRRLPRRLLVDLPLAADREAILRVLLRDERLDPASVSLADLARDTDLYSGSDLKNLCVAAAMHAVRDDLAAEKAETEAAAAIAEATAALDAMVQVTAKVNKLVEARAEKTDKTEKAEIAEIAEKAQETPTEAPAEAPAEAPEISAPPPLRQRVLTRSHFDRALAEIASSISDDMESLKSIRKFDEQYGDGGARGAARRRGSKALGFGVVSKPPGSEETRVRRVLAE